MSIAGKTVVCIGTGPSLTRAQIEIAIKKKYVLFGCNNAFTICPELDLLYGCNLEWWQTFYNHVCGLRASLWTTNAAAAIKYALNWVAERNAPGLSVDPEYIHHGHGGGYSIVSLAHRFKAERVILLGYDCKYADDYNAAAKFPGSTPRHFFGEYPASMQHWPSVALNDKGEHVGMIELYRSIARQAALEVINATPDSAIDAFPLIPIERT